MVWMFMQARKQGKSWFMKTRLLRPGFFSNSMLGKMPPEARLLFAGLWCLADREGRLTCDSDRIRVMVFPFDQNLSTEAVNSLLEILGSGIDPLISIYEVDGSKYIQINNFKKHQHIHPGEARSKLPEMPLPVITGSSIKLPVIKGSTKGIGISNSTLVPCTELPSGSKTFISPPAVQAKAPRAAKVETPVYAGCQWLRLTEEEAQRLRERFTKEGRPAGFFEAAVEEVELWLGGEGKTARATRARKTTHFDQFRAMWVIEKAATRANAALPVVVQQGKQRGATGAALAAQETLRLMARKNSSL